MKRQIKFKAKAKQDGKWHYGLLTFMFGDYAIVDPEDENTVVLIQQDSVCQFIGVKDELGQDIYESDKLMVKTPNGETLMKVAYYDAAFVFTEYTNPDCGYWPFLDSSTDGLRVIGNSHDNESKVEGHFVR